MLRVPGCLRAAKQTHGGGVGGQEDSEKWRLDVTQRG